jgi:hypothetical protein
MPDLTALHSPLDEPLSDPFLMAVLLLSDNDRIENEINGVGVPCGKGILPNAGFAIWNACTSM